MKQNFNLGLTQTFDCNYLPDQQEQLLIAMQKQGDENENYTWLMSQGFRRSADQLYRPHCPECSKCQSIRVMVNEFIPSKSQKRCLKKNAHLTVKQSNNCKESYYELYEQYINNIHHDGTMFPANRPQFDSFLNTQITKQLYIETWDENKLVCVAVTDLLQNALSAVYTFYDPDYRQSGLGVFSILNQIFISKQMNKPFLYLGYQIDDCQKMNYKNRYFPHQRLVENKWLIINKS